MSDKTFMTISKKECLITYKGILKNSDTKWESGLVLAERKDFGVAISLAIISVEELIKSLLVFFDGIGFKFRSIKGINTLFENHQIRYLIAFAMFVMGSFGEDIMDLVKTLRNDPQKIGLILKDKTHYMNDLIPYIQKKFQSLKDEFEWFSNIDFIRQNGFYCDFEDQLINPIEISEDDYKQVAIRLNKVRIIGKSTIEAINDPNLNLNGHLNLLKNNLKESNAYAEMSKMLASIKKKGENPFDIIKRNATNNTSSDSFLNSIDTAINP